MHQVIAEDSITLFAPLAATARTDDQTTLPPDVPAVSLQIRFTQADADGPSLPLNLLDSPELAGTLLDTLGLLLAHRGNLPLAHCCIDAALRLRQRSFGNDHPDTAVSHNSLGHVLRQTGEFEAARTHVQQAMAINTRVFGAHSLPVAVNLNELAVTDVQRAEFTTAELAAGSALQILKTLRLEHTDHNVTRIMDTQARIQQVRGNYPHATELYERLLKIDREQVGDTGLKYASHLVNYATVLAADGRAELAREALTTAIGIMEQDAPHHPDCIDALANLGSLQRQAGDCDAALQTLQTVIERDEHARGPLHPYIGNDHARLGRLHYDLQNFNAAEITFRKALQIYEHAVNTGDLPSRHAFIAEARTWLARTLVERTPGTSDEAGAQAEQALQDWAVALGERSVEYAITNAVLGRAEYLQEPHSPMARQRLQTSYPVVLAARGADAAISRLIHLWLEDTAAAPTRATG